MKIAIVCYPTFGGSGVMATELGMSLVDHGFRLPSALDNRPLQYEEFIQTQNQILC